METAMNFEHTMCFLFGDKAYQTAGQEANPKHRSEWLQKAIRMLTRTVNELDTTTHHKKRLMGELDRISQLLKNAKQPTWDVVYCFFRLVSRLLGYDYSRGARCHSVVYWQSQSQCYTARVFEGTDAMQDDRNDAISVRQSVIKDLKRKGLDSFKIALVLNTTEYEVKKLSSDPSRQGKARERR